MEYKVIFVFGDKYEKIENKSLDVECEQVEDINSAITCDNFFSQLYHEFQDIISTAYYAYTDLDANVFTFEDAHKLMYPASYSYIDGLIDNTRVDIESKEKQVVSEEVKKAILQTLKKWLYERIKDFERAYEAGSGDDLDEVNLILDSVKNFIAKGKWHYGLCKDDNTIITDVKQWPKPVIDGENVTWLQNEMVLKPVLWFAPDSYSLPVEYWSIYGTEADLKEKDSVWFPLSRDTLRATDLDYDSITERGLKVPKIKKSSIDKCPVILSKEETVYSILNKINQFFITQYNKLHGISEKFIVKKAVKVPSRYDFYEDIACSNREIVATKDNEDEYESDYTVNLYGEEFELPTGGYWEPYWDRINGKKCIWNWLDDGHDFIFFLWMLLEEIWDKDPDDYTSEADGKVHYSYDFYDQWRGVEERDVEIQLIKIFEKLEKLGYLESYTIDPEDWGEDNYLQDNVKSDGTIDLALIDESFKKNKLLMEQIELLMWSKPEVLEKPYYFLTDKDNKQYLSDTPGQFGGHCKLKIYGRLDCPSANRYVQQGEYVKHRVFFKDEATAIAAGYRPCAKCMPEAYKKWKAEKKK